MSENARTCGSCNVCCTSLEIKDGEFFKPADTECPAARPPQPGTGRCAIYANRPEVCRIFRCAWLNGCFAEAHGAFDVPARPDHCGIIFEEAQLGEDAPDGKKGTRVLLGYVVRPGAFEIWHKDFANCAKPGLVVVIGNPGNPEATWIAGNFHDVLQWVHYIEDAQISGTAKLELAGSPVEVTLNEP